MGGAFYLRGRRMADKFYLVMREDLIKDKRFSWAEKAVIAYHQSFDKGKRCFASDKHIGEKLGIPKRTVENLHTSIRKKTGIKGRNFSESALKTTRNCVVKLHDLQRIDKRVDKRIETKEETTQNRVTEEMKKMLKNPVHILNSIEAKENQRRKRAAAEIDIKRQEYLRTA
jgi:hypothetical protein